MNYCLVFGAPRSGTTYLQQAIERLRGVEGKIGQIIPVATFHLVNQDGLSDKTYEALSESVRRGIDIYLSGEYNSRFRALEDWWQAPTQLRRLWHVVRRGRRPRPDWFVYKEPFLSLAPEFAHDALPGAKFIYIYRDGRDVANSLIESYGVLTDRELTHFHSAEMRVGRPYDERYVPWWVEEGRDEEFIDSPPYVRAVWMWAYMVRRCHRYLQKLDEDGRILRVRYEHFMRQPEIVGEKIRCHIGRDDTWAFRRHLNQARTTSIGKYKQRSESENRQALDIAGDTLSDLGYL